MSWARGGAGGGQAGTRHPRYEMAFRVVLDVRLKYDSCTAAAVLDEMHF